MVANQKIVRHKTHGVKVGNVLIGSTSPIVVQSMTSTDTADVSATTEQIIELAEAGSEIVRITVNNDDAAKAVSKIKNNLIKKGYNTPLVGCFHYNGHRLLNEYSDLCEALHKYRINPGNVGFGQKHDPQFAMMIESAIKYNKAVRIGVNWGSLDKTISKKLMDENASSTNPKGSDEILREALIQSSLSSALKAEELGLAKDKIIISCKVSRVQDLISVYRELAKRSNYALHLGLTEAGTGSKGIVASTAALSVLLQEGIGDTIRISLTPKPNAPRSKEVIVAQEILQSLGLRSFFPTVTACPGCGRTKSTLFLDLADKVQKHLTSSMKEWVNQYENVETLTVAVMGCIVNGPGESKHSDIGISLPGTGEEPTMPVFINGKKKHTLRGKNASQEFISIINEYVANNYSRKNI